MLWIMDRELSPKFPDIQLQEKQGLHKKSDHQEHMPMADTLHHLLVMRRLHHPAISMIVVLINLKKEFYGGRVAAPSIPENRTTGFEVPGHSP